MSSADSPDAPTPDSVSRDTRLSARETEVVTAQLGALVGSGLPLAAGLRAAAAEAATGRVARALTKLATLLEQGRPLDESLAQLRWNVPAYLRRLLSPLQSSVSRDQLLNEWNHQRHALDDAATAVRQTLAYPVALLVLAGLVLTGMPALVGETFGRLYQGFNIKLQFPSQFFVALGGPAGKVLFFTVLLLVPLLLLVRTVVGRGWWRTTWSRIPLVGPFWRWMALAEWSRTVALLLDAGSTLPEALELAADDDQEQRVARGSRRLAEAVRQGNSFSNAIADEPHWPASIAGLVRHGEQSQQLATALRSAAEIYESRIRLRGRWLQGVLPTFVFLLVGYGVFSAFVSVLLPITDSISMFSFAPAPNSRQSNTTYLFAPLSLVGIAVLIATSLIYGPSRAISRGILHRVLLSMGVILLMASVLGLALSLGLAFTIIFTVILAVTLLEAFLSYRRGERQAILIHIAVAMERGIPLATALRAHGLEQTGPLGWLGEQVAQGLSIGRDLPDSLRQSGVRLTVGQSVAVGMGWDLGCLPSAVREALQAESDLRQALRTLSDKVTYISCLLFLWAGTFVFLAIKIVPVYRQMFLEFGMELPALTSWVFDGVERGLGGLLLIAVVVALVSLGLATISAIGAITWLGSFPFFWRFALRLDGSWVLRGVAWSIGRGLSVTQGLEHLQQRFPKARVRRRIEAARRKAEAGGAWTDALQSVGLLRSVDVGLLESAQRVGNLRWAIVEIAESTQRRAIYRLRALGQTVFPLVMIGLGGMLGVLAISMMLPLFQLIMNLSADSY